ncbi:hypothetical protein ACGFIR_09640 [Micromonospora sp. NPDC049051]|uniref:hypothetical protein n=1 Tax=Micromonospora sp. NPDC049051 TaxID=3364264 RepID=UPI00371078CA
MADPRVEVHGPNYGVIIAGDGNTVRSAASEIRLSPLAPAPPLPDGAGPAACLNPIFELVPFVSSPDYTTLLGWLDDDAPRGALLLAGPAGAGKTRLALQTCRVAAGRNWRVLVAGSAIELDDHEHVSEPSAPAGTLVLVDYADRWTRSGLQELTQRALTSPAPVRLLLVARSEAFWPVMSSGLRRAGFTLVRVRVGDGDGDATVMYRAAHQAFVAHLGAPVGLAPGSPPETGHPLSVHTKALLDVLGVIEPSHSTSSGSTWPQLSASLLDRELDHWSRMAADAVPRFETPLERMFRCVLLATMLGGTSHQFAESVLTHLNFSDRDTLLADHARLYPAPRRDRMLWPLLPDRLGEDALARALTTAPDADHLGGWGGPACDHLVRTLLAWELRFEVEGTMRPVPHVLLRTVLTVLTDTGERWPHVRRMLVEALDRQPLLSWVSAPGVVERLAPDLTFDLMRRLADVMDQVTGYGANLDMHDGLVAVLRRVCADPQFLDLPPDNQISHLMALGRSLGAAGDRREAAEFTGRAVALLRPQILVTEDEVTTVPGVDKSAVGVIFATHAQQLSALGQADDALAFSHVAVILLRQWIDEGGDETASAHIAALSTYATALADNGHIEESVELERRLLAVQTRDFKALDPEQQADASITMNNLGLRLREIGRLEEGRHLLAQTVAIRMPLARDLSPVYAPLLAEALNNLAYAELKDGLVEDAVETAEIAVDLRRKFVEHVRSGYRPQLSRSLRLLTAAYIELKRWLDAAATAVEHLSTLEYDLVTLDREQAKEIRDVLRTHAFSLSRAGRPDEVPATIGRLLPAQLPPAPSSAADLVGWLAIQHAARLLDTDDGTATATIAKYGPLLKHAADDFREPQLAFNLAYGLVTKNRDFAASGHAVNALLLAAQDDTALEQKHRESATIIARTWVDQADTGKPEHLRLVVEIVRDCLPTLETLSELGADPAAQVAALCSNAVAYGQIAGDHAGNLGTARLAVRAATALCRAAPDGRPPAAYNEIALNAHNGLALTIAMTGSSELVEARYSAMEAARITGARMREQRPTVRAASDDAMCLSTLAEVQSQSGNPEVAFTLALGALNYAVQCARVGGTSNVQHLWTMWQVFERHAKKTDQKRILPTVIAEVRATLPVERRREFDGIAGRISPSEDSQ